MNCEKMMDKLRKTGITFEPGMSGSELDRAEHVFPFRFPKEIRHFLSVGVPVGSSFFDYRDISEENVKRFYEFQASIERSFRFDLENNREDMLEMLGQKLGIVQDSDTFDDAVIKYLNQSVRLIPFYAHRCFFDGMDDQPIVSFWQTVDTILYGRNFENYLEHEFLKKERILEDAENRMKDIGIWGDIIC